MRRVLLLPTLVLSLALPSAAGAATGILALGDFGVGGQTERAIGAAIRSYEETHPADVLVTLGDNDYTASPDRFASNWHSAFGWLGAAGVGVAGTLGNHDVAVDGGRYEFDELGMPRSYYTRRVGAVQLFLLDSNDVGTVQTRWLRRALAASTARWKIAVFHHPAYTCGAYRSHREIVAGWVPLFERYGVRVVLNGHDHNYQRFGPRRRVTYIVDGGGGASLYAIADCPAGYPRRRAARSIHGFLYLIAGRDTLRVRALLTDGSVLDRLTLYP